MIWLKILLFEEKDLDAAWRVADSYGAPDDLLIKLSDASTKTHPDKALKTCKELVETFIAQGNSPAYKKAVKLIGKMKKLEAAKEFDSYLAALKEQHKRKRNLMKLL